MTTITPGRGLRRRPERAVAAAHLATARPILTSASGDVARLVSDTGGEVAVPTTR